MAVLLLITQVQDSFFYCIWHKAYCLCVLPYADKNMFTPSQTETEVVCQRESSRYHFFNSFKGPTGINTNMFTCSVQFRYITYFVILYNLRFKYVGLYVQCLFMFIFIPLFLFGNSYVHQHRCIRGLCNQLHCHCGHGLWFFLN